MNIEQLNKAGFSGDEIQSYMAGKRIKLIDAGFSGKEIDEHLGIPPLDDPILKQEVQSIITLPDPDGTKLEQGEEPSLWEKFFRVFEPSWGKRVAKSQISLEFAKETGLPPHVFEPTLGQAVKGGFEGSVTGLMMTGRLPQVPSHEYLSGNTRIAAQAATLAGDFPWMIAGAVLGAEGGPPTAVGGAFALPAGLRKVLMDKYEKGDIQSFSEFWSRLSGAVWETLKGEATGVATGKVGMMVPGMGKLPAEIVTMVTVGDALEGQIPEPQEFLDAAIVIGGMHASVHIASKLRTIYRDTGKRPSEIVEDIKAEPSIEEDILSDNRDVPEFYTAFAAEKGFRREVKAEDQIPAEPVKRSDIVKFLTEKLDVPIRTGRFWGGKSKFLGIFKLKPEVIRTRFANDIEVITHEVGHGLQKYLWPETVTEKGLSNRPFTAFKDELEPLATKPKAGQEVLPEGFAEFVRLYVTNAKEAKAKASKFYDYFEKTLDAKSPESREILEEARRMYDRWIKQPSLMRVLSQISIGEKARKVTSFTDLYTMAIDDLHPMAEMVREMRGEKWWRFGRWGKGEEIDISKDPYKLARLMRGWHGKAEHFFEYSPFKFKTYENIGKPLKDILTPLKGSLDEFRAYIASKRAIELDQRGIETGILREDAEKVVTDFGSKFEKVFRELKEYQDATLQYLADSGLLGADTLKQMREANSDYVPFYRVMEEARVPGTGRGLEARQPVKKIKGSWRDIHDPLESIIKNTYLYINLAEKNAVGRALIELAESKEGMGKYVEKIPTPMQVIKVQKTDLKAIIEEFGIDLPEGAVEIFRPSAFIPKENVISIWRNGKRELYEVHPEIARTMQALDRESMNLLMRILSKPAQWLRAGAVLTPEFMARNPIRDQFSAFCYTKYGFVPGFDMMRGIFSMAKKDQLYREWKKGGGAHSMLVSLDRQYLQKNLQELMRHPVRNMVKNPIELLRMLTEFSEAGTRIGEFKRARKKGAGIEEAAFASREVTLDFAKKGSIGKIVNNLVAFWSANLLGTDKMIRSFKERPGPTTMRVAASITLPSILLVLHNRQDERWKEIPQWQKDLFWIVMTEDHIWRIPKPFEMGILFGSTAERVTEFILDNDPAAFDGILKSLGRGASPGVFPTVMVPVIEDIANRSLFLDRPIVPANREDLLPEYQYKPYTTEAAKAMGKLLGKLPPLKESRHISPAIMENYIRGWSGGLGMHVLKVADLALRKAGALPDPVKPAPSLADIPVIKAFVVRHPSASAESIHKFYDQYFKAQQKIQTAKTLANKEFKYEEAIELLESAEVKLDSVYKALRTAHQTIDFIYQNQEMSPDEKRQLIDVTYHQMIAIAQEGNKLLKALKKAGKQ